MKLQSELPVYESQIEQFCNRVDERFHPDCIILHGSLVRGTYSHSSDADIIVISDRLPENFFERAFELNQLRDGTAPIEVVGYTKLEWEQMMQHLHLTVLEALHWGIPLHGEALFEQWKSKLNEWQSMGLCREETSWSVPKALRQRIH